MSKYVRAMREIELAQYGQPKAVSLPPAPFAVEA
jgi:hypothetical protein